LTDRELTVALALALAFLHTFTVMDLGFGIRRWLADLPHGSSLSSVEEKGKEDENTTLSMLIFNTKRTLFPANPVLVLKKQDMPNEVFYEVAEYLSLKDILALRQVRITLLTHYPSPHVPHPGQ